MVVTCTGFSQFKEQLPNTLSCLRGFQWSSQDLVICYERQLLEKNFIGPFYLCIKFSNCKSWLRWYLQPSNSSIIFCFGSLQHHGLFNHKTRASNAVESYHNTLYTNNQRTTACFFLEILATVCKEGRSELECIFH